LETEPHQPEDCSTRSPNHSVIPILSRGFHATRFLYTVSPPSPQKCVNAIFE